jgi:competence protein ComEC
VDQKPIWTLSPFFRILVPFVCGILFETYLPGSPIGLIPGFFLSLFIVLYSVCFPQIFYSVYYPPVFRKAWIHGLAIQLIFFSFARILLHLHQDHPISNYQVHPIVNHQDHPISNQPDNAITNAGTSQKFPHTLVMQLTSDPVSKPNSLKCTGQILWLIKDQSCFHENEKILVYFPKKTEKLVLTEGTRILFRKNLQPIENYKNSLFDYKKYCRLRHIYAQVYLSDKDYSIISEAKGNSISAVLGKLRKKIMGIIKKQIPSGSENSLLEALMVGYTDDLDPGLLKSYADSGVIHIIAISGLHLALIFHILQLAFKSTGQKRIGRWIKLIGILLVLWGYSFLSGSSPSVIRSAMMFSLVLFGRNIFREAVLYNILCASAFLLICFDPNWIWDTGFQLSYAAVLSLRLFSRPVKDLMPLQNKFLAALWDAGSVSIAAQILTTPVSIFYFHRFPSYFLIANLLAVPLSSAILVGGILLNLFAWSAPAGLFLGWLLGKGIRLLNGSVHWISQLPGSVISSLTLSLPQLIISYGIIFCFYSFLNGKEKSWLLAGLGMICFFQLSRYLF